MPIQDDVSVAELKKKKKKPFQQAREGKATNSFHGQERSVISRLKEAQLMDRHTQRRCVLIFGSEMHRRIEDRLDRCRCNRVLCTGTVTSDRLLYSDGVNPVPSKPVRHFRFSCRSRMAVAMNGHRDDLIRTASKIYGEWCRNPCKFHARPASQKH